MALGRVCEMRCVNASAATKIMIVTLQRTFENSPILQPDSIIYSAHCFIHTIVWCFKYPNLLAIASTNSGALALPLEFLIYVRQRRLESRRVRLVDARMYLLRIHTVRLTFELPFWIRVISYKFSLVLLYRYEYFAPTTEGVSYLAKSF